MSRPLKYTLLVTLTLLCAVAFLYWLILQPTVDSEPFDPARWKELEAAGHVSNDPGCYRGAMALGAIQNQMLIGRTTEEVEALLGTPEKKQSMHWLYPVGQCSFDVVHSVLILTFEQTGKVVDAEFKRDP